MNDIWLKYSFITTNSNLTISYPQHFIKMIAIRLIVFVQLLLMVSPVFAQTENEIYTPVERGKYSESQRIGVWEYRDNPNEISLKIDYTNNQILFIKVDTSYFLVKENDRWIQQKLEVPCRFHGSLSMLHDHYSRSLIEIASRMYAQDKSFNTYLVFEVDENGLAKNPVVNGDSGFGLDDVLLNAFATAPNFWISGVNSLGKRVTTKMAIKFSYCKDGCAEIENDSIPNVVLTMRFEKSVIQRNTARFRITNENAGIQFSPNDKKVLMEVFDQQSNKIACIVDLENNSTRMIPFSNTNGAIWIDNSNILFKYKYYYYPYLAAIFDTTSGDVTVRSDSATYFHTISSQDKIAFVSDHHTQNRLWTMDLKSKAHKELLLDPFILTYPISWSPDESKILLVQQEKPFTRLILYDFENDKSRTIPLLNAMLLGWSPDGKKILLERYRLGDHTSIGEYFEFDTEANQLTQLFSKIKGAVGASVSPTFQKFAISIYGNLYLTETNEFKTTRIAKGVNSEFSWSNNGKLIAFTSVKDNNLYVYDIDSKLTTQISNFSH